jgi:hypothetical protein
VVTVIATGDLGGWQRSLWRVAALALIVYSLRNAVLRSREFDADARARELDPRTQLGRVLAGIPARAGRRARLLGWTHPPGQARAAALADPAPLYRCGFWAGLAVGLVAAIGATAVREIVTLTTTTDGIKLLVPAVIFGAFAGAALAVAMWRNQLLEPGPGAWLARGRGVVIAAITGTALWGPAASAQGVKPAGSIGRDGWIRGHGYEIRLIPQLVRPYPGRQTGVDGFHLPVRWSEDRPAERARRQFRHDCGG